MQKTTNYDLKKLELTDSPPDITELNTNWDTIDQTLKANSDKASLAETNAKSYADTKANTAETNAKTYTTTHINKKDNPHGVTTEQIKAVNINKLGITNGVATLDASGNVPTTQLGSIPTPKDPIASNISTSDGGNVQTEIDSLKSSVILIDERGTGASSHAEGNKTVASGEYSHAEGSETTASGTASHVEGYNCKSISYVSHAEGYGTQASGSYSHAQGRSTVASGNFSHAEGDSSQASGSYSHAQGYTTIADAYAQHAMGRYNIASGHSAIEYDANSDALIIGNGSNGNARGNAFRVQFNGRTYSDSTYSSSGADYAEYFEWLDGNPNNEDRVGYFVTLDGEKIRKANSTDEYILGIVSSTPSAVGDNHMAWKDKYIKDQWGRIQYEYVTIPPETITEINEETGKEETIVIDPGGKHHLPIINPKWIPEQKYDLREDRKEWSAIGMVGKLLVRDDGTSEINGFCKPNDEGVATKSDSGYRVMKRVSETQILILVR